MSDNSHYMTADDAADALNISKSTLYAYVSRGMIRSEAVAGSKREKRYYRSDVERLLRQRDGKRNPEKLAQESLQWGSPVMDSAITLIEGGQCYYRGQNAIHLANTHSPEQIASLLWTGDTAQANTLFTVDTHQDVQRYETMLLHLAIDGAGFSPIQELQIILPLIAADDLSAYDLRPESVIQKAARLLQIMVSVSAGDVPNDVSLVEMLQQGYCPGQPEAQSLLAMTLILCADHELNASSFTARVVASAEATIYSSVIAGLATLQGKKHGGMTERVEALFDEVQTPERAESVLAGRLRRGEEIAGFGHTLYPDGDPRGTALIAAITEQYPDSEAVQTAQAILQAADTLIDEKATIDLGLVLMAKVLNLPPGTAIMLFALGRTIGWIGHALEQYQSNTLIRPRAHYTGKMPQG
ncbi:MAG: citrate synthase family protein [Aggregatilineales bacterium]